MSQASSNERLDARAMRPVDDAEASDQDEAAEAHEVPEALQPPDNAETMVPKKKKKNKGGKSLADRGPTALPKNRGSGFEEYFADPPMTPQEASEEKNDVYSPDFPFAVRMQSCIQRFRSRRRLQGNMTLYFNEYLLLGGVDTTASAFGGLDPKELKQLTPAQRREATAMDVIHGGSAAGDRFYNGDDENWSVNFAGVAAGFFSTALVQLTGFEEGPMSTAIEVVENFLRYVLHHDVCPEHAEDVKQALEVCNNAREEWPVLGRLQADLPGPFNLAATELFSQPAADAWGLHVFKRPEGFDAQAVFYSSMALIENPEAFNYLCQAPVKLLKEYDCTLEITKIDLPSDEITQRFKRMVINPNSDTKFRLRPLGKLTLKPATIEDGWDHPCVPSALEDDEVELLFEDNILANLKPGMKMTVRIGELGAGIRFVKTIGAIVPTFYTFLPQELMKHYKLPRDNDRPAPSIHDEAEGDQVVDE